MRKLFLHITIMFNCVLGAQSAVEWQQIYGGPGVEAGYSVKSCLGQGYLVVGTTSTSGPSDGYIVRTDSTGLVMWTKTYGGVNVDILQSVELLSDSGFIAAGYTNSLGNGGYDGWILRLDKNGDTLWTMTFGTADWDFFYDVAVTKDSGFVFAGGTYGAGNGDEDMLFLKLDSLGNFQWVQTYGGVKQDEAQSVTVLGDSTIASCGFTYSQSDTLGDSWILDIDELTGNLIWDTTAHFYGQPDKAFGISNYPLFGLIYVCGSRETSPGNDDPYISIWQYDGDSVLSSTFGGPQDEILYDAVTRPEGTVGCVGTNYTVGGGNGDVTLFHTVNWQSPTFGTLSLDQGFGIDVTHDGGYIMCGLTEGFGAFQSNLYLIKTDTFGNTASALAIREPVISDFGTSVYPNPSTESITITLDHPNVNGDNFHLEIFDVTGRKILSSDSWLNVGATTSQTKLDVGAFESGIYFYRISGEDNIAHTGSFSVSH